MKDEKNKKYTIIEKEDGFLYDIDAHIEVGNTTFTMKYGKCAPIASECRGEIVLKARGDGNGYELIFPEIKKKQYLDPHTLTTLYRLLDLMAKTTNLCGGHILAQPLNRED